MPKYLNFEEQKEIDEIEKGLTQWWRHRREDYCKECKQLDLVSTLTGVCNVCLMKKLYPERPKNG